MAHVEHRRDDVRVSWERGAERSSMTADRVVFAIPPTLLRSVQVTPSLSAEKLRALEAVSLESVTRAWVQADHRFWLTQGEAGRVDTDLPLGPARDETEGLPGAAGVLGLYVTRRAARELAALPDDERTARVKNHIALGHPGIVDHFVVAASKCWDSEPFQKGAYAYFKPGQVTAVLPHLGRAEGRLHFAGDHTSHRPGFMHGAVASADRVVAEVSAASTGVRKP